MALEPRHGPIPWGKVEINLQYLLHSSSTAYNSLIPQARLAAAETLNNPALKLVT